MKQNPFAIYPHRKQPRTRCCCHNTPVRSVVDGMVTLGSIAVIGGTTVGIMNAMQK